MAKGIIVEPRWVLKGGIHIIIYSFPSSNSKTLLKILMNCRHQFSLIKLKFFLYSIDMCEEEDETCCGLSPKWERRVMLTVVISLISFCYISFWILVILPWSWWTTSTGLLNIVAFHVITGFLVVSYYKTVTTSAGYVPYQWVS